MAHNRKTKYFSRKFNARKAMFRGLMSSLVEHERISTTVAKAKELRRHIERAITVGKKGDLATTRLLLSRIPNQNTVSKIVTDLSKRFAQRPGGYTRIIKIGRRPGDTAEMAFIEFVDYDWKKKSEAAPDETKKSEKGNKAVAAKKKAAGQAVVAKKKTAKKAQKKARASARA